jgi:hypothetical protein
MDIVYVESVVQSILDKEFQSQNRRKIVAYQDRLNICCPYCGDGKSEHKKRGNLYLNKLFYICFNCDKKTDLDRMVKDFNEVLDPDKKLEIIRHLESVSKYSDYETNFEDSNLEDLIKISELEHLFNETDTTPLYDFKPIERGTGTWKYLIGRGISEDLHTNIWSAKYSKGDEGYDPVICLLNRKGNSVISIQVRNLKEGRKRFFVIYNWETLTKWTRGENLDIPIGKSILYNKLSLFFNIMNVNFNRKITVFEGYIDSLFYPNSIGVVGVNTPISFLEDNNLDLQYFYDNDKAGFDKSVQKIKSGKSVFLWKKLFDWIVSNKRDDPYQLSYRISKVKDLNKLATLVENPYTKFKLWEFFSIDIYDLKYLPKIEFSKKRPEKDYGKEFKWNDF